MQTSLPFVGKLTTLWYNWICWQHVVSQQPIGWHQVACAISPLHFYILDLHFHIILDALFGRKASVAVHHIAAIFRVSVLHHQAFNEQSILIHCDKNQSRYMYSLINLRFFSHCNAMRLIPACMFGPLVSLRALQRACTLTQHDRFVQTSKNLKQQPTCICSLANQCQQKKCKVDQVPSKTGPSKLTAQQHGELSFASACLSPDINLNEQS